MLTSTVREANRIIALFKNAKRNLKCKYAALRKITILIVIANNRRLIC